MQFFNIEDDRIKTLGQDIWQRKAWISNATPIQPPVITVASHIQIDFPKESSYRDLAHFNKLSRVKIEQHFDPIPLNIEQEVLGLLIDNQVLIKDARYLHFSRKKKRIILKHGIL